MADKDKVIVKYAGAERPRFRRLGPIGTAVVMAAALIPLGRFMHSRNGPFLYVVSGGLFADGFDRIHVGSALDQPTIGKWYFVSTVFAAMVLPYVAVARWVSSRRTRAGYWAFAIPAAALCLYLLITLTVPFWWVVQYINAMGVTPRRIHGLVYGLGGYAVILGFFAWAVWPPKGKSIPPTA